MFYYNLSKINNLFNEKKAERTKIASFPQEIRFAQYIAISRQPKVQC